MGGWSNEVVCPSVTPPLSPDEPIREQYGVKGGPMGGGPYGRVVQWGGVFLCDPAPFPQMSQSDSGVELSGVQERGGPYGGVVQWGGVSVCHPAPLPR